ncbi:MAG TPA: hypothetical protein VGD78_17790 [Chthoniobacterales bacterium]
MESAPASPIGQPLPRVDGIEKVTGHARYAAEFKPAGLAHGVLLQAVIGSGEVRCIDLSNALAALCGISAEIQATLFAGRSGIETRQGTGSVVVFVVRSVVCRGGG